MKNVHRMSPLNESNCAIPLSPELQIKPLAIHTMYCISKILLAIAILFYSSNCNCDKCLERFTNRIFANETIILLYKFNYPHIFNKQLKILVNLEKPSNFLQFNHYIEKNVNYVIVADNCTYLKDILKIFRLHEQWNSRTQHVIISTDTFLNDEDVKEIFKVL